MPDVNSSDISILLEAANRGDAEAQLALGYRLRDGDGAERDENASVGWFRRAADQGNVIAWNELGVAYRYGYGVEENWKAAREWFEKAAERGLAEAQCNLGLLFANENDDAAAAVWYRKAAEQGDAFAQCQLGMMYDLGHGVAQDKHEAEVWLTKSAEQEDKTAQYWLGSLYLEASDQERALIWFTKAARHGDADAQFELGAILEDKARDEEDNRDNSPTATAREAVDWYVKAAEQDCADAEFALGKIYKDGLSEIEKDEELAVIWYRKVARRGAEVAKNRGFSNAWERWYGRSQWAEDEFYPQGQWFKAAAERAMAECFVDGRYDNGPINATSDGEAFVWLYWSSRFHDYTSTYLLGRMYEDGRGVAKDDAKAAERYRDAGDFVPAAAWRLGMMYESGRGVELSEHFARWWYKKAAKKGSIEAKDRLAEM